MKYDDDLNWKDILLMIVVSLLVVWIVFFGLNSLVSAADSISRLFTGVTKAQIDQAVEDGAIQRTSNKVRGNELEVVNNYGEQSTIDTNQLQGSRNE
ncbi:MAG TPA: hypothetical protein PKV66_00580 [Candidatus Pelethenecus sp.]|nr:hypothetical protein [Candidatus Pelethenecus sp.]